MLSNKSDKLFNWYWYIIAAVAGVATTIVCVFLSILLASIFGPSSETGYAGSLLGGLIGISAGSFVSGRIMRYVSTLSLRHLKVLLVSPGVWIAAFILVSQVTQYGIASEYFRESIMPCIIGVILSFSATYLGTRGKK